MFKMKQWLVLLLYLFNWALEIGRLPQYFFIIFDYLQYSLLFVCTAVCLSRPNWFQNMKQVLILKREYVFLIQLIVQAQLGN